MRILDVASIFLKLAQSDVFVYTFVPAKAVKNIRNKGLLSARELINDKKSLNLARPDDKDDFIKQTKERLEDPEWEEIVSGVSVFFTLPDFDKINDKHHIIKNNLIPISINLTSLIKDLPKTKILGVELLPSLSKDRERKLSLKEVKDYSSKTPQELWKHYKNPKNKLYAPNVPHAVLITPDYKINPRYIIS